MGKVPQRTKRAQPGFTLVELLVVIAIIGILAGLLAPAFVQAKVATDSAVCKNNLRQLGIATRVYADTYEAYPWVRMAYAQDGTPLNWQTLLEPFVKDFWPEMNYPNGAFVPRRGAFACAGYNRIKGMYLKAPNALHYGSYGFNAAGRFFPGQFYPGDMEDQHQLGLGGQLTTTDGWKTYQARPTKEEAVLHPSEMILMGDAILFRGIIFGKTPYAPVGLPDRFSHDVYVPGGDQPSIPEAYKKRHGGRWNVVFCDGHVENMKTTRLFDRDNDEVLRRWNNDHRPHR